MQIAEAFVAIRPKTNKAEFQSQVEKDTTAAARSAGTKAGDELGKSMTTRLRAATSGLGAVLGSVGAGLFLKSAFDDAREFIRTQAQLQAVLKSTGGEAGVTSEHIEGLAQSQQKLGIADDEVTKRGAALLLT